MIILCRHGQYIVVCSVGDLVAGIHICTLPVISIVRGLIYLIPPSVENDQMRSCEIDLRIEHPCIVMPISIWSDDIWQDDVVRYDHIDSIISYSTTADNIRDLEL